MMPPKVTGVTESGTISDAVKRDDTKQMDITATKNDVRIKRWASSQNSKAFQSSWNLEGITEIWLFYSSLIRKD